MNINNIDSSQYPNMVYLSLLLVLLVSSFISSRKFKTSTIIKQATLWSVIALIALIIYSFRHDFYQIKNRVTTELFPNKIMQINEKQIAITVSNNGHYYIEIKINQHPITFMVDTGASDIVLNLSDSKKVGINFDKIYSFKKYQTANGSITSGLTQIKEMELGKIKFYNVDVSISDRDMGTSLLGMSFLNRFKKYEFYQDRLVLTY